MTDEEYEYDDNGYSEQYEADVMQDGVTELASAVIGRRIISVDQDTYPEEEWGMPYGRGQSVKLTLDDGTEVYVDDTDDCCAFTTVEDFKFLEGVDNAITSVDTADGFTKWFIYAGSIPVVEMDVAWSPGNPYYYGFGFGIRVKENN